MAPDHEARAAWEEWKGGLPLDRTPEPDMEIVPLAARRILGLDPDDPDANRYRGLLRYTWSRNQLLISFGGEVLRGLEREGIETLVLKGVALGLLSYRDLSVRPMADLDVLVPRDRAADAVRAVSARYEPAPGSENPLGRIPVHHSVSFLDESGRDFDLHWYSLFQSSPDADFWEAAVPLEVAGARTLALSPPDQLLHVCAHGAVLGTHESRWVADAATVIQSAPDLDWERVTDQAVKRELTLVLADALEYLSLGVDAPVPQEVTDRLRAAPTTAAQRAARRAVTRPLTARGAVQMHRERYGRLKRLDPEAPRASSFPSHLKSWFGFESYRGLAGEAARRVIRSRG